MNYKIVQLILSPNQQTTSINEVFVAQPDANKEALAGKLFVLAEIESKNAEYSKLINFLISTINHNYYQNEKIILREKISALKVEHIFELALTKTNKKLAEFLQNEKIKITPQILNITIGVIYNNFLHFTNLGKNKALLIYKNKTDAGSAKHKIADITNQINLNESRKQTSVIKLFTNVINGSIPPNGYFLFTNEAMPEYLSNKQLIDIITVLPPASAVEQIKNTLSKINAYVPFSIILIKNTLGLKNLEIKKQIPEQLTTQSSVKNLNTMEEKTENLLIPSGLIDFNRLRTVLTKISEKIIPKSLKSTNIKKSLFLKDKIFLKKKLNWLSIQKIISLAQGFILYLMNFIIFIFKTITNKETLKKYQVNIWQKIIQTVIFIKQIIYGTIFWFKNLSKKGIILFLVFVVCLILLTVNLTWINLEKRQNAEKTIFIDLVKLIEQKQNQIDAGLLYGNEKNVKILLKEITELLVTFPLNTAEQKEQYDKINQKKIVQLEKISKVIRVDSPTELANFINLSSYANPINIILSKEKIYASDQEQKIIYSLELANNLITAITDINKIINKLNSPSLDKDNNIYYLSSNNIVRLDKKTETLTNITIKHNNFQQFIDIKFFNNRLYCLAPKNKQIIRFNKSTNKFTDAVSWINDDVDLTEAISMDIDGNIYILKNNGELLKFIKGKKENFELGMVEPALTNANKIISSVEQKYIYILDIVGKRLLVFDKSGKFINQYVSNKFNNLKDFTVDETAKKIYFLNNTSVLLINAKHLGSVAI
ncbi:hypothetical protein KKH16_00755 [Patescibacteria group bacterium]|nr:hypothetical protein [Patescibacteria group bacterium]